MKSHAATLDGTPLSHNQPIDLEQLGVGFHTIDLEVAFAGGERRRMQGAFNVLNKIDVAFEEPVTRLRVDDEESPNQADLRFVVSNGSSAKVFVVLETPQTPAGWKAAVVGENLFELGPGRKRRLTLKVELMNDVGFSRSPLPFTLSATTPWIMTRPRTQPFVTANSATAYVEVAARAALAKKMEQAQAAARRRKVLIYGPM